MIQTENEILDLIKSKLDEIENSPYKIRIEQSPALLYSLVTELIILVGNFASLVKDEKEKQMQIWF